MNKIIEDEIYNKPVNYEPKVNNRFVVYMENVPCYLIKAVTRPIASVTDGKYIYGDLILHIYDPIAPSASQVISEFIRANKTEFDEIKLVLLGPIGDIVEEWRFLKCKVVSIEHSKLDWSDKSDVVTIKVTLKPEEYIHEF